MTYAEFIKYATGKTFGYPSGSYVGECLSLVKIYIKNVYGINPPASGTGSAYGYWSKFPSPLGTKFKKVANTPSGVPKKGDIMIWKPWSTNQYGHISIVTSANVNYFYSLDQNWGGKSAHTVKHNYTNPAIVGWLTPKGEDMAVIEDLKKQLAAMKAKYEEAQSWRMKFYERWMAGKEAIASLNGVVETLEKKVTALSEDDREDERIKAELQAQVTELSKIIDAQPKEVDEAEITKNWLINLIRKIKELIWK